MAGKQRRRRLEDLYVRGREFSIDDGGGDPVVVWLQKLNPLEHEKAIRKASAAKAQIMLAQRDREGEIWQEAFTDVTELGGREILIDHLIGEDSIKIRESREAELAHEDEWKKEGYLDGLRDAWEDGGLGDRYAADPEDEEAHRVFLELKRFSDQVEERAAPEIEALRRDLADTPTEELQDRVVDTVLDLRAGMTWLQEYRRCEVFFAVRDPDDHEKYYFHNRDEVDRLAIEVFRALIEAYEELTVSPAEGKDSGSTQSSSPSSEPSSEEETPALSGLQAVAP